MADPYTDLEINAHAQLSILEALRHYNPEAKLSLPARANFTVSRIICRWMKSIPSDRWM